MIPPLILAAAAYAGGTILGALLGGPWWITALLAALLALTLGLAPVPNPDTDARAGTSRRADWAVLVAAVALVPVGAWAGRTPCSGRARPSLPRLPRVERLP